MMLLCEPDAAGVCVACGQPLGDKRRVCSAKQPRQESTATQPKPPEPTRSACCDRCAMSEKDSNDGSAVWCQPLYMQLSTSGGGCCGNDTPTRYAVTNAIHAVEFGILSCPVKGDQ